MVTLVPSLGVMKGTKQSKKATFSFELRLLFGERFFAGKRMRKSQ